MSFSLKQLALWKIKASGHYIYWSFETWYPRGRILWPTLGGGGVGCMCSHIIEWLVFVLCQCCQHCILCISIRRQRWDGWGLVRHITHRLFEQQKSSMCPEIVFIMKLSWNMWYSCTYISFVGDTGDILSTKVSCVKQVKNKVLNSDSILSYNCS